MSPRAQFIAVVGAILLVILVVELVRRRKLRVGYSLLWLLVGLSILGLVMFQDIIIVISPIIGIKSPRSLLFAAGIVFALFILLEHSLTLTILWRQNKCQAQEHALLEWRVRQLENLLSNSVGIPPCTLASGALGGQRPSDQTLGERIRESVQ